MIIGYISLTAAIGLFAIFLITKLILVFRKRKYLVRKKSINPLRSLRLALEKNNEFKKILNTIAIRIGIYNNYSMEKNREYSSLMLILLLIIAAWILKVTLSVQTVLWYVKVLYLLMGMLVLVLLTYLTNSIVLLKFTLQLPEAFKILNSRYTTEGDILKAIDISVEDFSGAIQREMIRIRNVLRKNNREKIDETFSLLEQMYQDEYFTLLLNLISQAYYKGGKEGIKKQFENITEEILTDIENKKDLILTSRMYMLLGILLPLGLPLINKFNGAALGEKSTEFLRSGYAERMQLMILITIIFYIGTLLYMEKTQ
ncbi:hypothetical protein [Alkaliphilus crotonatoxidans]